MGGGGGGSPSTSLVPRVVTSLGCCSISKSRVRVVTLTFRNGTNYLLDLAEEDKNRFLVLNTTERPFRLQIFRNCSNAIDVPLKNGCCSIK